ncbi:MAG TPA: hypothetical protein VJL59_25980 [Anaerolineales bacterium]|nr:hypothetical protein [Anaerolineales bacterium]
MSRKSLPLGIMAMILIVALATIGVAYGMWSETLIIKGEVHTGEVDVAFSPPWVIEIVEWNGKLQEEPKVKAPYASCEAWLEDGDEGQSDGDELLRIKVTDAYPSYHCFVFYDVSNIGTVPVHISKPYGGGLGWVVSHSCWPPEYQLHPGRSVWAWILIHFTNKNQVAENADYFFGYSIDAWQWNEKPAVLSMAESDGDEGCTLPPEVTPPDGYGQ